MTVYSGDLRVWFIEYAGGKERAWVAAWSAPRALQELALIADDLEANVIKLQIILPNQLLTISTNENPRDFDLVWDVAGNLRDGIESYVAGQLTWFRATAGRWAELAEDSAGQDAFILSCTAGQG